MSTNPIDWLQDFKRNPIPPHIVWDVFSERVLHQLSNDNFHPQVYANTSGMQKFLNQDIRGRRQYYWLDIDTYPSSAVDTPVIVKARLDSKNNTILIDHMSPTYLRILLRPEMLANPEAPVTVQIKHAQPNQAEEEWTTLGPIDVIWDNPDVIWDTMWRLDPSFIFTADIVLTRGKKNANAAWEAAVTPFGENPAKL